MKVYSFVIVLLLAFSIPKVFDFNHSHADLANEFLYSLSKKQKALALMDFEDMSRVAWTYFPASILPHAGISFKELDENQKKLVHAMLRAYLSEKGYTKTVDIISLESILFEIEDSNPVRDPEHYVVGIYGQPNDRSVWGWTFQGHHIALNFTIVSNNISMAPRFFGASPAEVKSGPKKGLRVLHAEEDIAFELLNMLDKEQTSKAIFSTESFIDIVTGTSVQVAPLAPAGISFDEMNVEQQKLLRSLIVEYLSAMPTELAVTRLGHIDEDGMSDVHFGWAGSTKRSKPHYYRIQGPSFLVEFDNTQNNANHVHTVWRDFNGDFGRNLLQEHYKNGHHK